MTQPIKCPKCGTTCGEWEGDHIKITKIKQLIYGAQSAPRTCGKCGHVFDLVIKNGGAK